MTAPPDERRTPSWILYGGLGLLSVLAVVLSIIALTRDPEPARFTREATQHNEAVVRYCAKHHPESAARLTKCVLHTHYSDLDKRKP